MISSIIWLRTLFTSRYSTRSHSYSSVSFNSIGFYVILAYTWSVRKFIRILSLSFLPVANKNVWCEFPKKNGSSFYCLIFLLLFCSSFSFASLSCCLTWHFGIDYNVWLVLRSIMKSENEFNFSLWIFVVHSLVWSSISHSSPDVRTVLLFGICFEVREKWPTQIHNHSLIKIHFELCYSVVSVSCSLQISFIFPNTLTKKKKGKKDEEENTIECWMSQQLSTIFFSTVKHSAFHRIQMPAMALCNIYKRNICKMAQKPGVLYRKFYGNIQ